MEIELRPRYGLLSLAYLAGIYSLSSFPGLGITEGDPLVALGSNLLHIPLFAGLTFCLLQAISARDGRQGIPGRLAALAFLGAGAVAALDEWHQSFVPGRHASVGDFLLDLLGIGGMLLLLQLEALRETTKRPVTVTHGTNRAIGTDPNRIVEEALWTLNHPSHLPGLPPFWDGRAESRIVKILLEHHREGENGS